MKNHISLVRRAAGAIAFASVLGAVAQPIPVEARQNIHRLFDGHESVSRRVETTETGYVAVTESEIPEVRTALREHVRQMKERIESGRMVRGWDPAFRELVAHARDIRTTVEDTDKGVRVRVEGRTPEAVRVARNHARIVSGFAADGWEAHDRRHPVAADDAIQEPAVAPAISKAEPAGCGPGKGCCGKCAAGGEASSLKSADGHEAGGSGCGGCCKAGGPLVPDGGPDRTAPENGVK